MAGNEHANSPKDFNECVSRAQLQAAMEDAQRGMNDAIRKAVTDALIDLKLGSSMERLDRQISTLTEKVIELENRLPNEEDMGDQVKREAQNKLASGLFRGPGAVCTKIAAQVTYGLGFGRSLYGWKAKKITFQMALVPGPNSSRVDGKMFYNLASRICLSAVSLPFGLLDRVSCLGPLGLHPGGLGRP